MKQSELKGNRALISFSGSSPGSVREGGSDVRRR
jgi:hypothetical protein